MINNKSNQISVFALTFIYYPRWKMVNSFPFGERKNSEKKLTMVNKENRERNENY